MNGGTSFTLSRGVKLTAGQRVHFVFYKTYGTNGMYALGTTGGSTTTNNNAGVKYLTSSLTLSADYSSTCPYLIVRYGTYASTAVASKTVVTNALTAWKDFTFTKSAIPANTTCVIDILKSDNSTVLFSNVTTSPVDLSSLDPQTIKSIIIRVTMTRPAPPESEIDSATMTFAQVRWVDAMVGTVFEGKKPTLVTRGSVGVVISAIGTGIAYMSVGNGGANVKITVDDVVIFNGNVTLYSSYGTFGSLPSNVSSNWAQTGNLGTGGYPPPSPGWLGFKANLKIELTGSGSIAVGVLA